MSAREKFKKKLSDKEIDRIVTAQVNDDSAWQNPVRVRRHRSELLSIPADLAARGYSVFSDV